MSLFSGTPITAQTSSQSTVQTPQWLQDSIYNQINLAQAVSKLPFQNYTGQAVAGATGNQQAAWQQAASGLSGWQPAQNAALQGLQNAAQGPSGLQAAQPYLNNAAGSAASGISTFMNPYNQQVTDRIAQLGARNLSENLLPAVGDSFVKAGQFGGSRMGEFGARALRDTQEAVLGEQSKALQGGFNTALGASQGELNRQLQLGETAGSLSNSGLSSLGNLYSTILGGAQNARQEVAGYGEDERGIQQGGLDFLLDQYKQQQAYPQQQTNFLTQQLGSLSPMVQALQKQTGVEPTGNANASTLSQILGGLSGIAGIANAGKGSSGGGSGGGINLGGILGGLGSIFGGGGSSGGSGGTGIFGSGGYQNVGGLF